MPSSQTHMSLRVRCISPPRRFSPPSWNGRSSVPGCSTARRAERPKRRSPLALRGAADARGKIVPVLVLPWRLARGTRTSHHEDIQPVVINNHNLVSIRWSVVNLIVFTLKRGPKEVFWGYFWKRRISTADFLLVGKLNFLLGTYIQNFPPPWQYSVW